MITRLEIGGFKSIRKLDVELGPINILLGGNGAGKSNFISIFTLIKQIHLGSFQNYVQKKGGPDSLLHFGRKNTSTIDLTIYLTSENGEKNLFKLELEAGNQNLFIKSLETAYYYGHTWHFRQFESNTLESQFAYYNHSQAYYVNDRLKEFDVYHFHDTSDSSPIKGASEINDNQKLKNDGSNLSSFLYFLQEREPKHFKRIEMTIRSIAPFFERFDLKPSKLNPNFINLEWKEKGFPESYFNSYHLSDGTLRFICLATLLMQPNPPSTIIIDEPELGLHPVAINKLASLIRKASAHTQIVISTQSVNLIDNFEPEDIIVTDRKDKSSSFQRLKRENLKQWLEDFTLGDIWGQNKIGAQPYRI